MTIRKIAVLAALFASLIWGAATAADAAPRGNRFYVIDATSKVPANIQLADALDANRSIDKKGTSLISPEKCHTFGDGSCASRQDFVRRILAFNPNAKVNGVTLNVDNIPEYYRSGVVMRKPPPGVFAQDCEKASADSPSGWSPLPGCVQRPYHFKTGELAYVDRITGVVIGAEDCANPVGGRIDKVVCGDIDLPAALAQGDMHYGQFGTVNIARNPCTLLFRPGETEGEAADVERCTIDDDCDLDPNGQIAEALQWTGSYPIQKGTTRLRVPLICTQDTAQCRIVFCKYLADGSVEYYALGVRSFAYLSVNGELVATIYDNQDDARAAGTTVCGKPTDLYWREDTDDGDIDYDDNRYHC